MGGVLLALLSLTVYLPGITSLPPIDRDESRFAQASRQMFEAAAFPEEHLDPALHDGGLVIPKVGDRLRLNKPPLIYWLQASSAAVFTGGDPRGDAIWMYRVPSVLGATAAVLLTWFAGARMFGARTAWLGAAMLAVSPMVVWDAHQARADQVLLACCVLSMFGLHRVYSAAMRGQRGRWIHAAFLWLGIAAGVMTKGPITPMIVILAAAAISVITRRWRWLGDTRPISGLLFTSVCVLPWVGAVAAQVGWGEYIDLVFGETVGRSASAAEGHWGPPGYHLALIVVVFWPGAFLLGVSVIRAVRRSLKIGASGQRWRGRRAEAGSELFLISWVLPSWIVFELVSTKLPHYPLPLYPALALLTARGLMAVRRGGFAGGTGFLARLGFRLWSAIGLLLLGGSLWLAYTGFASMSPLARTIAFIGGIVTVAGVLGAVGRLLRAKPVRAQPVALLAGVGFAWLLTAAVVPTRVVLTPRIDALLDEHDPRRTRPVAALDYHEDSLVFETRGRLRRLQSDHEHARLWLDEHPNGILVLPAHDADELPGLSVLGTASGLNYSNGRMLDLVLVERADD